MKRSLIAVMALSFATPALAQEVCSSIMVYQTPIACASAKTKVINSKPQDGLDEEGQIDLGERILKSFNKANAAKGIRARLAQAKPVGEDSDKALEVKYTYKYKLELITCGLGDKYEYVDASRADQAPKSAWCLSCDDLKEGDPSDLSSCLSEAIGNVINPKAVSLRDSDLKAVAKNTKELLRLNKHMDLLDLATIRLFDSFLTTQGE